MKVFVLCMQAVAHDTLSVHGMVVKWSLPVIYLWEVPGSNFDMDTNIYMWYFSWFFQLLPGTYQDSTLTHWDTIYYNTWRTYKH